MSRHSTPMCVSVCNLQIEQIIRERKKNGKSSMATWLKLTRVLRVFVRNAYQFYYTNERISMNIKCSYIRVKSITHKVCLYIRNTKLFPEDTFSDWKMCILSYFRSHSIGSFLAQYCVSVAPFIVYRVRLKNTGYTKNTCYPIDLFGASTSKCIYSRYHTKDFEQPSGISNTS